MAGIPARPSVEQYKKQAKELVRAVAARNLDALDTIRRWHPQFCKATDDQIPTIALTDAQLVIARSHAYPSWPKFAAHIETLATLRALEDPSSNATLADPLNLFLEFASVERHGWHGSGSLDQAELILKRFLHRFVPNIFVAAVLADEPAVRALVAANPSLAVDKGGPFDWDPLTYLCFSRYLRLDKSRSDSFVACARILLDAGASANTGWMETLNEDPPRQVLESAIYAAAGIAHNPGLTRLLLERGADPNDEETCYHAPETWDNATVEVLIDSGRCNERSLAWLAARKADWHDLDGLRIALNGGANPNFMTQWSHTPFQHAIRRDNRLPMIATFLDHGADPSLRNEHGRNAFQMAADHGRGDILVLFEQRGLAPQYDRPLDALVAACARGDLPRVRTLLAADPDLQSQLLQIGGTLLARFAGCGNLEGVRILLDLGVPIDALWPDGDPYFDHTRNSTALHVAAWRAHHDVVSELIARGAPVNATDARNRTPLQLAVRACVDSYWKDRRAPDSVAALLAAGATVEKIKLPTGYDAIDSLLLPYRKSIS
jgi:ankyrin repeat protein